MRQLRHIIGGLLGASLLLSFASADGEAAQAQAMISLTRDQIIEGAKKEGKLRVVPGHDDTVIPGLVKGFQKKYPFIQTTYGIVTGIEAGQRQLFEMATGTSSADAFSPSSAFFNEYFSKNLIKRYDFRAMSKAGHLKIPLEMIDESGVLVWLGTNTGVITYNSKLVPEDKAPKGWESCLDPYFRGKFSVDSKPNVLAWLSAKWNDEKLLSYAKRLKENSPVFSRGNTRNITQLVSGEVVMNCGMYIHVVKRTLKHDPSAPIKMVIPDPFPMSSHEPEAVYANAKNPHAALLWIEFLASKEGQQLAEEIEPGRGSFLVEGTLANKLSKGANVALCADECRHREEKIMQRIAVEAWGLPKVGASPK
ncbi:MAG TPA: extracellular solute-binding protein [Candidatus Acidoferrales bacterium]|nr:extracellular solute-binding protein [Candidatus Acidoferrales bacterium]